MEPVDVWTMIARIALAAGLGLILGLERERHGRAAGLRTCVVLSATGALLMSLSVYLSQYFGPMGEDSIIRLDPARLPSYAIAGMGFLGAGAIIQGRSSAIGVTTAAALWTCTGVGLAIGAGLYLPALATVLLALASLTLLKRLARFQAREQSVNLTVKLNRLETHQTIKQLLAEYRAEVRFVSRERLLEEDTTRFSYYLIIRSGPQWNQLLSRLEELPGLVFYCWDEASVP